MVEMAVEKWISPHARKVDFVRARTFHILRILLERLCQVEALLHIIVGRTLGVNVSDAAVTSVYSAVLLQSLDKTKERRRRK